MSKLTAEQRRKLPESSFGDPARRLFPILDQDDVDSAASLIGKAKNPEAVKKRIIAIAQRLKLSIPDAWKESANHSGRPGVEKTPTVTFDNTGRYVDGEWAIYPNALLFEAGEYTDKDFSLSPEEMMLACESFVPVSGNIEHTSFLDGRACEVRRIFLDPVDSSLLRGEVAVPVWLDEQLSSAERRLSCEWDRSSKALNGVALTVHPRIPEASLMAAYASFARPKRNTPTGQRHLQQLHDLTVERGATCAPGSNSGGKAGMSQFASTHEARAIQQVHDVTVEHGATCEGMDDDRDRDSGGAVAAAPMLYSKDKIKERKRGMNLDFKALFSGLFGALEEREGQPQDGTATPPVTQPPVLAPARAQNLDASTATVQLGAGGGYPVIPAVTTATTGGAAPDPRIAELEKQLAERDATIAREAEARIQREASLFAEEQVRAQKATPAEQEKLALTFAQAMRDDQRHDAVTFGEGDQKKTTSRVQQLRDVYEARPAGLLTQQMLPDGQDGQQTSALYNQQQTARVGPDGKRVNEPLSAERRRQLLEGSSLGRAIVRDQSAAGKNGNN